MNHRLLILLLLTSLSAALTFAGTCACSLQSLADSASGQPPYTVPTGLRGFEVRRCQTGRWVVSAASTGISHERWYGSWDTDSRELTASSKEDWDSADGNVTPLEQTRAQYKNEYLKMERQKVYLEGVRTKTVRCEAEVEMEWILRKGVKPGNQYVIVLGTSSARHRKEDKLTLPPMATPHYVFSSPKTLRVQSFSLPDLKPAGPVVTLNDAVITLPERGSADGCSETTEIFSASDFPGVLIVGGRREMWIISEAQLTGGRP